MARNLDQRNRMHELLEQVAAFAGGGLQGGEGARGIGCARSFAALRMTTGGTLRMTPKTEKPDQSPFPP